MLRFGKIFLYEGFCYDIKGNLLTIETWTVKQNWQVKRQNHFLSNLEIRLIPIPQQKDMNILTIVTQESDFNINHQSDICDSLFEIQNYFNMISLWLKLLRFRFSVMQRLLFSSLDVQRSWSFVLSVSLSLLLFVWFSFQ